jgi:hypothetical protein
VARQFRQLGLRPSQTTGKLRGKLQLAQRRLERLVQTSSRNHSLLTSLEKLHIVVSDAYDTMPLQRLSAIVDKLTTLKDDVVTKSFFTTAAPLNGSTREALLEIKQDVVTILQDLQQKRSKKASDKKSAEYTFDSESIRAFFDEAAARGWKVPQQQQQDDVPAEDDGFVESRRYLHKIAVERETLLHTADEYGLVTAPVILLNGYRIPESTLISWTEDPYYLKVHYIFGKYVVIDTVVLVGLRSDALHMQGEKDLDVAKFLPLASHLLHKKRLDLTQYTLIKAPRKSGQFHYCPFLPRTTGQQFLAEWDLLVRQDNNQGSQ